VFGRLFKAQVFGQEAEGQPVPGPFQADLHPLVEQASVAPLAG